MTKVPVETLETCGQEHGALVAAIDRSRMFANVDRARFLPLLESCPVVQLVKGQCVLSPGERNTNLYIVASGRLNVHLGGLEFPPYVVLEAGDCAGELSAVDARPVSAHVVAAEASRLLVLPQPILESLIDTSHAISKNVLHMLADRVRQSNEAVLASIKRQRESEQVARIDGLTGVHNRRWLEEMLHVTPQRGELHQSHLTLAMLDIDHFKEYNDRFGHLAGDRLLSNLAQLLAKHLRPDDMVARYGGDEFVVLLPRTPANHAVEVANRLRTAAAGTLGVTISMGLASYQAGDCIKSLLVAADEALYRAKRGGRNLVCYT